jgi:predicted HicB family RNase H-like nuclease
MTCQEGKALNVRPITPELREALRGLARDAGQELYQYVIRVLTAHVEGHPEPAPTPAEPSAARGV